MQTYKRASVLIIDNNPEALADLKDVFESRGYLVYTANTIKTALFRVSALLNNNVTVDFALVSDRIPGPMGATLSDYVQQRLGIGVQKLISPNPENPSVDYEDLIVQWTREMRIKELDFKEREKRRAYMAKHSRPFWTFDNGVKKVNN